LKFEIYRIQNMSNSCPRLILIFFRLKPQSGGVRWLVNTLEKQHLLQEPPVKD
jgi:hypothetical protein